MLIRKGFEAIPAGGALAVYETIIDDDRSKNAFGLMMSLNMLIETPGGFDYTGADCAAWMKDAGFSATRLDPLVGAVVVVLHTAAGLLVHPYGDLLLTVGGWFVHGTDVADLPRWSSLAGPRSAA